MGGRLIYMVPEHQDVLGVLDAWNARQHMELILLVQGLIAGGKEAFTTAIEGAEDS